MAVTVTDDLLLTAPEVGIEAGSEPNRPRISILAYSGGLMRVPAWGDVALDLDGLDSSGQIALLADHDARVSGVVGHGAAEARDGRLLVSGVLSGAGEAAKQIAVMSRGGTQHITQSRATVNAYAPSGETPPDFQGAIGVTDNGVEGVDVTVPVYHFSETHYLDDAVVTPAYKGTLFSLTGKVNSASFKGLAAGECLFLGAAGSKRGGSGGGDWEITFRFAGSPNVTGLSVGPITGISKKGWEYLWVRYAEVEDEGAQVLVKRPIAAYVERVYDTGNFAALGIGT